jgi:hypothetical protein
MPDEADLANDYLEREIEQRILEVQKRKPVVSDGRCRNCGADTGGAAFCDTGCSHDYEDRERHNRRAGLR